MGLARNIKKFLFVESSVSGSKKNEPEAVNVIISYLPMLSTSASVQHVHIVV
jgi:hypothetical protein